MVMKGTRQAHRNHEAQRGGGHAGTEWPGHTGTDMGRDRQSRTQREEARAEKGTKGKSQNVHDFGIQMAALA